MAFFSYLSNFYFIFFNMKTYAEQEGITQGIKSDDCEHLINTKVESILPSWSTKRSRLGYHISEGDTKSNYTASGKVSILF